MLGAMNNTMTQAAAEQFFADVVPAQYWRPIFVSLGGDLSSVIGTGKHAAERRILAALAELTDMQLCDRCGGSGQYGHYGVCYECGGRRLVSRNA